MPVTENLPTEYHQQDTNYYCGAACAQMVLHSIGAGHLSQDDLYNDNHSHSVIEGGWYTAPDGLGWTLNNRKPAAFTNHFVLFEPTDEETISRKIVWTIHHYMVAPVAMVYGSAHWIVVKGFEASAAPSSSGDSSYSITGFFINNPWPPTPGPLPPPHSTGDLCGSGGDYGIVNEHISYGTWQGTYMTGIPGGHWAGKFVALCDPEPAAKRSGIQSEVKRYADGEKIIDKKMAMEQAMRGIEEYRLTKHKDLKKILANTKPADPVLVHRLDKPNEFYYIVPLQGEGRNTVSLVNVDARFGNYMQSGFAANETSKISFKPLAKEAILKLLGKRLVMKREKRVITIYPEAICIYPALVWRPCRESLSPYMPFHMVTVGDERIYIRVDGRVFTSLHINEKGI
ncbi:MAG: hypothetical protein H7Y01_08130 [Ferruginibacter sp.]|nr:hypothetical protein [Chitinophagaceae bacterium]